MELKKQSTCIIGNREWYKRPLCTTKVHIYLNVATTQPKQVHTNERKWFHASSKSNLGLHCVSCITSVP